MINQEFTYCIPTDHEHFSRFYEAIAQVSSKLNMTETQRYRFALCVSEAFTNAYVHGNKKNPEKNIYLGFHWDENALYVDIEDEGEGEPESLDLAGSRPDIKVEKSGGRGVGIMKSYADNVEVEERAEGGLRVTLTFTLHNEFSQLNVLPKKLHGG